jgi:arginine utilization protein RocB
MSSGGLGRYGPLIYYNDDSNNAFSIPPTTISPVAAYYNREYYPSSYTFSQAQQQNYLTKDSFKQSYMDMLREEAEKLFTSLEKMLVDEVIDQYVSKTTAASSSSLPGLPFDDKQQQKSSAL